MKILPSKNIIICLKVPPEKTKSGLILHEDEKARSEVGIVYAIGAGKLPMSIKIGDKIVYRKYTDNKVSIAGDEYNFIEFKDITGKVTGK